MGRSEAPLSRDPREETPGGANRKQLVCARQFEETRKGGERFANECEKLRGVESKFNERDPGHRATQFRLLFFQPHPNS